MPVSFVHLQVHSEYSLLSALPTVRELVAQAARLRLPALALTDFGNLFGAIEFYTEAMRAGIKPILGMEAYLCADHTAKDPSGSRAPVYPRVVLLARNMRGWKNLIRLSSLGYLEGFYWRPRIDHAQLAAHADGLVAITSGWHGEIEQLIRAGRTSEAEARARWYREVFGSRFFIAVQRTGVEGQEELNERMVELARRHDIPLVATNDVHMLHPSDYEIYRTMLRIQPAGRSDEETVNVTEECFLRAPEIMAEDLFGDLPEAVANTVAIARMCNVDLPFGQYQLPEVEPPEGLTQEDYLRRLAYEGLDARWPEITARNPKAKRADYEQRLDFELATIARMGYVGYF
ncbi:MAG: PHP domain-containing protein, partial [Zetaproteobacteria bacterium]